jgi:flagellar protein FlaG
MSTQNINSALSNRGLSPDNAPAVSLPKSKAAPADQPSVAAKGAPSAEHLQRMLEKANRAMDKVNSSLEFSVDDTTNKTVIKVTEANSGKLIMQFPSEEMLSITRAIDHAQKGVLVKEKA